MALEADDEVVTPGETVTPGQTPPTPTLQVSGYIDAGFSQAQNRGRGFIFDTQNRFAARYPGIPWILIGDPLSTAVNSRGEPADTTGSFAFIDDPVDSSGSPTFMINEVDVDLSYSPRPDLFVFTSFDFLPRSGNRGSLGDRIEIDYAYADWTPFKTFDLTLSAGKFDSAFGREYRMQESPDRIGVTPSLLFRYVAGHPLGVKARTRLLGKRLVLNVALANGSSFVEAMQFAEEIDHNDGKTVSGRLSFDVPLPFGGSLDLGASGEQGTQARQSDDSVLHSQFGADATLAIADFNVWAEVVDGKADGGGVDEADGLNYTAWSVTGAWRAFSWLSLYGRFERRDAVHTGGSVFVYVIDIERITAGVRLDLSPQVILKAEYLVNRERKPLPSFDNDVAVASLVVRF